MANAGDGTNLVEIYIGWNGLYVGLFARFQGRNAITEAGVVEYHFGFSGRRGLVINIGCFCANSCLAACRLSEINVGCGVDEDVGVNGFFTTVGLDGDGCDAVALSVDLCESGV